MGENILSWNVTNWITVVVMAVVGFTILAVLAQVMHSATGGKYAQNSTSGN